MYRRILVVGVPAAILIAAVFLPRPTPQTPERPRRLESTGKTSEPSKTVPRRLPPAPARSQPDRGAKKSFLDRLGRALVTGDWKTVEDLWQSPPTFYDRDVGWLLRQIDEPLFRAAGAADACLRFGLTDAIPILDARLRSTGSVFLKDQIVRVLGIFGGKAKAVLIHALGREQDPSVRVRITFALARIPGPGTRDALALALRTDPSPLVRKAAAQALARLETPGVVAVLMNALEAERDASVRGEIIVRTYFIGGRDVRSRLEELTGNDPAAAALIRERVRLRDNSRYLKTYPEKFFESGGRPVDWDPTTMDRIGITIDLREAGGLTLEDAAAMVFTQPPLDRYASFFYLRDAEAMEEDLAAGVSSPRVWEASGTPIPGGLPITGNESTVFIRFRDPNRFGPNILGYTEGTEANVTKVSLFHELGHAFAGLGDEYESPLATDRITVNLHPRDSGPPPWQPLVAQGHLPSGRLSRGDFRIPSGACHMNNLPDARRWCPVCQLEFIARITELADAPLPW